MLWILIFFLLLGVTVTYIPGDSIFMFNVNMINIEKKKSYFLEPYNLSKKKKLN